MSGATHENMGLELTENLVPQIELHEGHDIHGLLSGAHSLVLAAHPVGAVARVVDAVTKSNCQLFLSDDRCWCHSLRRGIMHNA